MSRMSSTTRTAPSTAYTRKRERVSHVHTYKWPWIPFNAWMFLMLLSSCAIVGVFSSFIAIQYRLELPVPWCVPPLPLFLPVSRICLLSGSRRTSEIPPVSRHNANRPPQVLPLLHNSSLVLNPLRRHPRPPPLPPPPPPRHRHDRRLPRLRPLVCRPRRRRHPAVGVQRGQRGV